MYNKFKRNVKCNFMKKGILAGGGTTQSLQQHVRR